MTTEEFSNEFDTLLNSYSNTEGFGKTTNTIELDEYEKSVFLTKAQEDVVIDMCGCLVAVIISVILDKRKNIII